MRVCMYLYLSLFERELQPTFTIRESHSVVCNKTCIEYIYTLQARQNLLNRKMWCEIEKLGKVNEKKLLYCFKGTRNKNLCDDLLMKEEI